MTKKDFFILAIKLFGLSSALSAVFYALPSNLGNLVYAFQSLDWALIILVLIILMVTVGLFIVLIFKAHSVVEILQLDKGFNDARIELGNFKSEDLIKKVLSLSGAPDYKEYLSRIKLFVYRI